MKKVKDFLTKAFLFVVYAADENTINLKPGGDFSNVQDLTAAGLIGGFIKLILVIASIVFFFILVIGGVQWIVSGGDKQKTEEARGRITAALVGLVIVFAAWAIAQLIGVFFGIHIFNLNIPVAGQN